MPDGSPESALQSFGRLAGRVAVLLAVAVALEVLLRRLTSLPASAFEAPVLVLALAREPYPRLLLLALASAAVLAVVRRSAGPAWTDVEHGRWFRGLIVLAAFLLAWSHATYPYNFHFGRAHGVDRLLLVVLLAFAWWRPLALLPFLVVLLTIVGQFAEPIGGFSPAALTLPLRMLFVATAFWLVRMVTPRVRTADPVFLVCCLVAAHYWVSGWAKIQLDWLADDRVSLLLPTSYGGGWLAGVRPETIGRVTGVLGRFDATMRFVTLALEVGSLFALAHRRLFVAMLAGWIGLHAAIFAVSGILFWEWMLLDAALLVLLFTRGVPEWGIFTLPHFALSLVLIFFGALWFRPYPLAWLDSPVNYIYRIQGIGASGRTYQLAPRDFAPYDYQFTLGDFGYLDENPLLPIAWGAIRDRPLLDSLMAARTAGEVLSLEARHGRRHHDAARAVVFDGFVRRFVAGRNARGGDRGWWRLLQPPARLWTFHRGAPPDRGDAIERVVVEQVTTWFDGRRYLEIRTRPVRFIDTTAPD